MQELEITWPRVLSFLWLWMWRGALGGGLIAGVLTAVLGQIEVQAYWTFAIVWIAGLAWQAIVVRMALRKNYRDFRIVLVPSS